MNIFEMSPSFVEAPERDPWLDMYAAASLELQQSLGMRSVCEGMVPLLACRKMPLTEFNRSLMLEDLTHPCIDELVKWLERYGAGEWALQIAESKHTTVIRDAASALGLEPTGAGWSKLIALSDDVFNGRSSLNLQIAANAVPDFGNVIAEVYGLSDAIGEWFSSLARRPQWHLFVAYVEGEVAGAAAMYVTGNWAWLGIDATIPKFRGRGVQSALIETRASAAANLGIHYLTAETGLPDNIDGKHTSRNNYVKSGLILADLQKIELQARRLNVRPRRLCQGQALSTVVEVNIACRTFRHQKQSGRKTCNHILSHFWRSRLCGASSPLSSPQGMKLH
jgi:GNAT superfamily N-acetyltransferase